MESPTATQAVCAACDLPRERGGNVARPLALIVLIALLGLATVGTAQGTTSSALVVPVGARATLTATARSAQSAARSPFSADLSFQTPVTTMAQVAYGIGAEPTLWTPTSGPAQLHSVHLSGLRPATRYRLLVNVVSADGRHGTAQLTVRTPAFPRSPRAAITGGVLTLDGEPFFPVIAFGQCDTFDQSLARGVSLFLLGGCRNEDEADEAASLAGQGFAATSARSRIDAPQQIGYVYPDEADEHGGTFDTLPALPSWQQSGKVSFLTLTNHFYSGADPLPQGRAMYPGLARRADMLGFDLYPLQVWCRRSAFQHVYLAQRELDALVSGRPTYQWIETAPMGCDGAGVKPTSKTVEAETWLAIAGGADGIGWFPWSPSSQAIGKMMKRLADEIATLQPALLAPEVSASATARSGVYATARVLNGATYVFAVNSTRHTVATSIAIDGLVSGQLETRFEPKRTVLASGGVFSDTFGALQTHVYVVPPPLPAP